MKWYIYRFRIHITIIFISRFSEFETVIVNKDKRAIGSSYYNNETFTNIVIVNIIMFIGKNILMVD